MPSIDSNTILLHELNTLNAQTYTTTDVSVGFSHVSGSVAKGTLKALSGGAIPNAGSTKYDYQRLDIQTMLTAAGVTSLAIRQVAKISNLLSQLSQYTGINLNATDIIDADITYTDGQADVVITAATNSPTVVGSGNLHLVATAALDLSTLITTTDYASFAQDDVSYVKQTIQASTTQPIDWSAITVGTPVANTDSSSTRNSKAVLTAVSGAGYTGSVTIYFNRTAYPTLDLPQFYAFPLASAWTGTPWQWLNQFYPQYVVDYQQSNFQDVSFTIPAGSVKYTVPVQPEPGHWTVAGSGAITVNANVASWIGDNVLQAFDSTAYAQEGFTDYTGKALSVHNASGGVVGAYPVKGAYSGPFGGGLGFPGNASILSAAGAIATSAFVSAWTLDMWVYNDVDLSTTNGQVGWAPLQGSANLDGTTYTDRISIAMGPTGNATYGGKWLLYNNLNAPRVASAVTTAFSKKGWQHVAFVYNGSGTITCYLNGAPAFTITGWSITAGTTWVTGFASIVTSAASGACAIERWRLCSGAKWTAAFTSQDLYSQVFSGSKQQLTDLVTTVSLGTLPDDTTDATFIQKVSGANNITLRSADLTFTQPTAVTDARGNTKITITATSTGRYLGSVDVFFTRQDLGTTVVPTQWNFSKSTAFSGTALDYLADQFPTVVSTYFSDWTTAQKALSPAVTLAAGEIGSFQWLLNKNKYQYVNGNQVTINPATVNWPGANTVAAWDSSIYVQAGFTDKAGNNTIGAANIAGTAGVAPTLGTDTVFAYGKGIDIKNGTMTTTNQLAGTTFTSAFTVDFWVKLNGGTMVDTIRLPYGMMTAMPSNSAFTVNSRVLYGAHDVSIGYLSIWNNLNTARAIATTKYTAMCASGWHHVAITYDGAGVSKVYFDGVLILTFPTWTLLNPGASQIGIFGQTNSNIYPTIERYRFRTGVKFTSNFAASAIYV